jgi:AcrR family transcriptional regulator
MERKKPSGVHREIVSRRDRPAKPPLSREGIIDTALDLLARGGLAGLSLRKVATELDTGPASLYVYIANLNALYDLILDRVFGEVEIPETGKGAWRERLSALLTSYTEKLISRPGLGRLAMTTVASGPKTLRLMEAILALLLEGGLDGPRAAWAVDALLLHFSAIASEQDSWREHGNPLGTVEQALEKVSPEDYPNIHALTKELLEGDGAARHQWTLDVLLNGVLNTPR